MKPTEADLEALEAEHGAVYQVPFGTDGTDAPTLESAEHVFVIRRPRRPAFERFERDCLDEKRRAIALRNLAVDVIV